MTTLEFAKKFNKLSLNKKMETLEKLNKSFATKTSITGKKLTESELKATSSLVAWCGMNVFIGGEMCPPSSIKNY